MRASIHIGAALALFTLACSDGGRGEGEPCSSASDCSADLQCLESVCAPTCQNHVQCGDGYRCEDNGDCVLVESAIGDPCVREIDCGPGQICAIDGDDRDGDGVLAGTCQEQLDGVLTGNACELDDDCQTGLCSIGLCSQLCGISEDCPPGSTCAVQPRLLATSEPLFSGCLPSEGVVVDRIPITTPTSFLPLVVPSNAQSFAVVARVDEPAQLVGVTRLIAPDGRVLFATPETVEDFYDNAIRYQAGFGVSTMLVPNTPAVGLQVGVYRTEVSSLLEIGGPGTAVPEVEVHYKLDRSALLDLHFHFLDLADHPCANAFGEGILDAEVVAASPEFEAFLAEIDSILTQAGIRLGVVTYQDVTGRGDLDSIPRERLGDLLALADHPTGIDVFVVRSMSPVGVQAMVGGTPGPPGTPGTRASGIAISADTLCYRSWDILARITAHSLARQMGLYHNRAPDGFPDTIPDSDESIENLMFFGDFGGSFLSPGQRDVLSLYPGLRGPE